MVRKGLEGLQDQAIASWSFLATRISITVRFFPEVGGHLESPFRKDSHGRNWCLGRWTV